MDAGQTAASFRVVFDRFRGGSEGGGGGGGGRTEGRNWIGPLFLFNGVLIGAAHEAIDSADFVSFFHGVRSVNVDGAPRMSTSRRPLPGGGETERSWRPATIPDSDDNPKSRPLHPTDQFISQFWPKKIKNWELEIRKKKSNIENLKKKFDLKIRNEKNSTLKIKNWELEIRKKIENWKFEKNLI